MMDNNVQNYLLQMTAVRTAMETGKVPQVSGSKNSQPKDDFRKLMDESRRSEQPQEGPGQKQELAGQADKPAVSDEQALEHQMSLAAMSVLCPVIQAEDAQLVQPQQLQAQPILTVQAQPETKEQAATLLPEGQQIQPEQTADTEGGTPSAETPATLSGSKPQLIDRPQAQAQPQAERETGSEPELKVLDGQQAAEQPLFREVESVPVKVGDVPGSEQVKQPVSEQIGHRLDQALRAGESRVELELEPRSLGKVTIEMTLRQDGSLHVLLRADKPATQALLDRGAGELQGLLGREARQDVVVETGRYQQQEQAQVFDRDPQHQEQHQDRDRQNGQHRQDRDRNDSFLQQLRLGLTPTVSL